MDMVPLKATARSLDRAAKEVRTRGSVPCVLYGNTKHTTLQCAVNELAKVYVKAGENTLVDLDLDGKKVPVLFHALQFHPVSGRISHVDFYAVDLKKEIEAPVPLRLTGESPAVKEFSAVIITVQSHVTVRCLPMDLPHDIEASLAELKELHSALTVADLAIPRGVKVTDAPEIVLVIAQEQRKEEEVQPVAAALAEAAAEGAVPAEGAAPAEGAPGAAPAATAAEAPAKKEKKGK